MGNELTGKVAIVTGAGRGIGRAYAHALADRGAQVVVSDLAPANGTSAAETVAEEIRADGGNAVANHADVSVLSDVARLVETAVATFGRLDILVANAGIARPGRLFDLDPADWNATLSVHATGTFNCIHEAAPALIEAGGGSIITVGDITTDLYYPNNGAYRAAKAAIAVTTMYTAEELREFNINVNAVMPGSTATGMVETYLSSIDRDSGQFESFVAAANKVFERPEGESASAPAAPETVPPLGIYLCTDEARSITGRFFCLANGLIRLVGPRTEPLDIRTTSPIWSTEELEAAVPPLVARIDSARI
ncbi:SDR family NAD(P)-dependent oxidoreductase [Nocardia jiangxiensis]|uniref:SDR family NAD(P)-dependent oxidoreductase n=1 Tax=Nocardia jiangxiensis TaxID=282685 RepID=A0ABW6RZ24_9NOCA